MPDPGTGSATPIQLIEQLDAEGSCDPVTGVCAWPGASNPAGR